LINKIELNGENKMEQPTCPNCGKSGHIKYKQLAHESGTKFPRDLVAMAYCTSCGHIIGIGAGR